jgi:hypothetical protein
MHHPDTHHEDKPETVVAPAPAREEDLQAQRRALRAAAGAETSYLLSVRAR